MRNLFVLVIALIVICVAWTGSSTAQNNSTTDNSITKPIKVEKTDGTVILITGDGDNVIHYNSPENEEGEKSKSGAIIQQNDDMEAFVVVMSFPIFENDGMTNTFTELIIPLYYDGSWDLLWVEE